MASKFEPAVHHYAMPRAPRRQPSVDTVAHLQFAPKAHTAPLSNRQMAALAASSALMAIGVVVMAALAWVVLFVPHPSGTLGIAAIRFAFADSLLRRDMLEELAFGAALAWVVVTIAILWWRGGVIASLLDPSTSGGRHGN